MSQKINIALLDDHQMFRDSLTHLLGSQPDIQVVASVGSSKEAYAQIDFEKLDVLLLDISIGTESGVTVGANLRKAWPGLPIVYLTMYPEDDLAARLTRRTATGYVSKSRPIADLVNAIRTVYGGDSFINAPALQPLEQFGKDLSKREAEIVNLFAQGKGPSEIGAQLKISKSTVGTHLSNIREYYHVQTNFELLLALIHRT